MTRLVKAYKRFEKYWGFWIVAIVFLSVGIIGLVVGINSATAGMGIVGSIALGVALYLTIGDRDGDKEEK